MTHKYHILTCGGKTCESLQGKNLYEQFIKIIHEQNLDQKVQVVRSACFGFCQTGPMVKIYPEGAFYAWAQINKDEKNSEEISNYLLEKAKVVTVPGSAYGLGGDKCIRMSFATATSDLYEAAERIKKALS